MKKLLLSLSALIALNATSAFAMDNNSTKQDANKSADGQALASVAYQLPSVYKIASNIYMLTHKYNEMTAQDVRKMGDTRAFVAMFGMEYVISDLFQYHDFRDNLCRDAVMDTIYAKAKIKLSTTTNPSDDEVLKVLKEMTEEVTHGNVNRALCQEIFK